MCEKEEEGTLKVPAPHPSSAESIKYNKQKTQFPLSWASWVLDKGSRRRHWCFQRSLCQVMLGGRGGGSSGGVLSMLNEVLCHQAAGQPSGRGPWLVLHWLSSSGGGFLAVTPLSTGNWVFSDRKRGGRGSSIHC